MNHVTIIDANGHVAAITPQELVKQIDSTTMFNLPIPLMAAACDAMAKGGFEFKSTTTPEEMQEFIDAEDTRASALLKRACDTLGSDGPDAGALIHDIEQYLEDR